MFSLTMKVESRVAGVDFATGAQEINIFVFIVEISIFFPISILLFL